MKSLIINLNRHKRRLVLTSLLFYGVLLHAQTGLQFLGVKHIEIAANSTATVSVASAKVWKIESVSMGSTGSAPSVLLKSSGSGTVNMAFFSSPLNASSASYPYWLPSLFTGTFINNNPNYRCSISITEYSVSP